MTDICSVWAYDDIKKSGYVGRRQAMYLSVFTNENRPLTHRQASDIVNATFFVRVPERNGRVAELEDMGLIEKFDRIRCDKTRKIVNRWKWTGSKIPFPKVPQKVLCEHCHGTGYVTKEVYVKDEFKEELF